MIRNVLPSHLHDSRLERSARGLWLSCGTPRDIPKGSEDMDVSRTDAAAAAGAARRSTGTRYTQWIAPLALSAVTAGCSSLGILSDNQKAKQDSMAETLAESARIEAASSRRNRRASQSPEELLRLGESELAAHSRTQDPTHLAGAKRHFQTVLQEQPGHATAHHRLAVIADLERDYATASRHYHQAIQASPNDPHLLHDIGYSYALQGKHQDAIPYFQRSIQVDPSFEPAVRKLADAYIRTGQDDAARQTLLQIMPQPQAAQEIAQLKRHNEADSQTLLGKVKNRLHDLRPDSQSKEQSPTQQLMAELELARAESERLKTDQSQPYGQRPSNANYDIRSMQHGAKVPDAHLSQALAEIDYVHRPTMAPHVIDPRGGGMTTPDAASPWGNAPASQMPQINGGQLAGYYAASPGQGGMGPNGGYGTQMQVAPNQPQSVDPSYTPHNAQFAAAAAPAPQSAGPGQFGERGMDRGAVQPWPSRNWREQSAGQPGMMAQGSSANRSMIQPAGGPLPGPGSRYEAQPMNGAPVSQADHFVDVTLSQTGSPAQAAPVITPPRTLQPTFQQPSFSTPQPPSTPQSPAAVPQNFQAPQVTIPQRSPEDDLRAAAAVGLGAGPGQMLPVIQQSQRLSPGANSTWNGLQFPQPGRILPTDRPHADLSAAAAMPGPDQGTDALRTAPNSLGQQMPSTGQYYTRPDQYAASGWGTQPNFQLQPMTPPVDTTAGQLGQNRAQLDQRYNQTIQQGFGQSPANAMMTPSVGLPPQRLQQQQLPPSQGANGWSQQAVVPTGGSVQTPEQYPSTPYGTQSVNYSQPSADTGPMVTPTLQPPAYAPNVVVPDRYQPQTWQQDPGQYGPSSYNGPVISPRR